MITALSERSHYSSLKQCVYLNQAFLEEVGRHGNMKISDSDEVAFFSQLREAAAASHIITLTHRDGSVDAAVKALRTANIVCGSRNNRIRVSLAHYNDESDLRSLTRVLQRVPSR
jgi:selenocysteine lyase/cysteine desulfurase